MTIQRHVSLARDGRAHSYDVQHSLNNARVGPASFSTACPAIFPVSKVFRRYLIETYCPRRADHPRAGKRRKPSISRIGVLPEG
jgi:hypothetical protein